MDILDLKPGAPTGGHFVPSSPEIRCRTHASRKEMVYAAIIRSMSTREADTAWSLLYAYLIWTQSKYTLATVL